MLSCIRSSPSHRGCIFGDSNIVANSNDKCGGSPFDPGKSRFYFDFIEASSLMEIPIKGGSFTWSNQRKDDGSIREKLDRILSSLEWSMSFPKAIGVMEAAIASDHSPTFLLLHGLPKQVRKDFKFESKWLLKEKCSEKVLESWESISHSQNYQLFGKKVEESFR
ncbi:hypothetical protein V6N11_081316 [Hibiscus sabdariffa]|uniref:Reverse transcriptase n=1 Tax=Hibiscus sabdariffa TaxID=183260 RepID=A0ABR2QK13_9ROSI